MELSKMMYSKAKELYNCMMEIFSQAILRKVNVNLMDS